MSTYNNQVAKIADKEIEATIQKQLNNARGVFTPRADEQLKNLYDKEYYCFIEEIFATAFYKYEEKEENNDLRKTMNDFGDDIIPILREIIRICTYDYSLSKSYENKEEYPRRIGSKQDIITVNSDTRDVVMKLLFIPATDIETNRFRLEVVERLSKKNRFPYISFSVDIGDDGSIIYNKPVEVDLNRELGIIEIPSDMSQAHVKISKQIAVVRDVLVDVFDKVGVIENTSRVSK